MAARWSGVNPSVPLVAPGSAPFPSSARDISTAAAPSGKQAA